MLCKSIDWFIYDSSIVRRTWLIDIITLSLLSILNIISLWNNFSCGLTYNCLVGSLFFKGLQTKNSIIFSLYNAGKKMGLYTAWKVSVFGVFLVHIFLHLDSVCRNAGKCGPEKLRIRRTREWIPEHTEWIKPHLNFELHFTRSFDLNKHT